ncbi:MAG: imelysin family protein, partial [Myxococcales bacterium]|nr:imelysin family protein [Myxococcales bacterium]
MGRVLGVLGVGIVAAGCNSKASTNPIPDGFDHASLIRSWATDVIVPTYAALAVDARALRDAVKSYQLATASGSDEREQLLDEARQAWGTAMEQCQEAELMQMGPAGPSGPTGLKGGENLRDELYSWPTVSACRVDQELVDGTYADTDFFERETVNAYGMDALEYLLFNEASAHSCPPQANLDDAWDALGEEELTKRRASYAASVAEHVLATAEELQARWDPASGNFIEQFIQPGTGGSVYDNNRCVIDEVFASLFYIEFKVKDMKLGIPSGVRPECVETQCPEAVESRWAKR